MLYVFSIWRFGDQRANRKTLCSTENNHLKVPYSTLCFELYPPKTTIYLY